MVARGIPLLFASSPADALVEEATRRLATGDLGPVDGLLREAFRLEPDHPMALIRQAELALLFKDHGRAVGLLDRALAREPNLAPAWYARAAAAWAAGRPAEALEAARRAVDIQPPNPQYRHRLAQCLSWVGAFAEAYATLEPIRTMPEDTATEAATMAVRGEIAIAEGRFAAGLADLDRALALWPDQPPTRMLRGMTLLRLGRFTEGWADYAARESVRALYPTGTPMIADAPWRGEDLRGRRLLVFDDQGHGDAIQMVRYLPMLRDRGVAQVTWWTMPALVSLFAGSAPYATVIGAAPVGGHFDYQCNSTSLPRWFGTTLSSIPDVVPYLRVPGRPRVGGRRAARALQVGLVWSGDSRHMRDHHRSIPARLFLRLADEPGIVFHSLQHEVRAGDAAALGARPAIRRDVERARNLADTAALIAGLDLVIAVDTGVAHLAAALGKPVWIILHVVPDWRWLTERPDSPWYPGVRLFRVAAGEWRDGPGWEKVLGRVAAALRRAADEKSVVGG